MLKGVKVNYLFLYKKVYIYIKIKKLINLKS